MIDRSLKPTFLGIGSGRCGSTWLGHLLSLHPDVQVSKPQQLSFFNANLLRRDANWYCDNFRTEADEPVRSVRGEVTAGYCRLERRYVENMRRFMPDLKVLLTIRYPVDRIWSHAQLDFTEYKAKDLVDLSIGRIYRYSLRSRTRLYTDYQNIIELWSSVLGPEAVHVELFESVVDEPSALLQRVCEHIGADSSWSAPEEKRNTPRPPEGEKRQKRTLPEQVRWAIAVDWLPRVRELNRYLNGRVEHWVQRMEGEAGGSSHSMRFRRQLNRKLLHIPEHCAYSMYESFRDRKFDRRWAMIFRDEQ